MGSRAEIAELAGFIGTLQMEVEGEAGALAALAARAGELEEGRAALVALREQQEAMDERVARMQLLLLVRLEPIHSRQCMMDTTARGKKVGLLGSAMLASPVKDLFGLHVYTYSSSENMPGDQWLTFMHDMDELPIVEW